MKIKTKLEFNHDGTYTTIRESDGAVVKEGARELKEAQEACGSAPGTYRIKQPDIIGILKVDVTLDAPPEEPPVDEPPPDGADPFTAQYAPGFKLKPLSAQPIPSITRPAKSTGPADFIVDPVHGTHVHRIVNAKVNGEKDQLRPDYSRRQTCNADDSLHLLTDGSGTSYPFDAYSFAKASDVTLGDGNCGPCWHPTNPALIRHTDYTGGLKWYETNVLTSERRVLFDFTGKTPWPDAKRFWTKAEGSFSADGRYVCLQAETSGYAMRGLVCVDVIEGRIVGTRSTSQRPDHVSMSACGRWCVVSGAQTVAWPRDFDAQSPAVAIEKEPMVQKLAIATTIAEEMRADPDNLDVVDDWDEAAATNRVLYDRSEHSNLGFGPIGESVIVHAIYHGTGDGRVGVTDLDTGETFYLPHARLYRSPGSATAVHISMQAFDRPGWALLSTYDDYGPAADPAQWPMIRRVSLHELKPDGRAFGVADIHSDFAVGEHYFHEPQATINRNGSRVFFASSYSKPGNSPSSHAEAYMVPLPPSVYEQAAA